METAALASWGGDAKRDNRETEVDVGSETEICLSVFLEEEEGRVSFADSEDFIAISAIAMVFSATLFSNQCDRERDKESLILLFNVVCKLFLQLSLPFF